MYFHRFLAFVVLGLALAVGGVTSAQEGKVVAYDAGKESAQVRQEITANYAAFHEGIAKGDFDAVDELIDEYFELHYTFAGLRRDDDYTSESDFLSELENGESFSIRTGEGVANSKFTTKITALASGRRFAATQLESVQSCDMTVDGQTVKLLVTLRCADVWQKRQDDESKELAFKWQFVSREVISLEYRINGKVVPIEIDGS